MSRIVSQLPYRLHEVKQRNRTPLGRFAAWCVTKSTGTIFQRLVTSCMVESLAGRLAGAIVASLLVAIVLGGWCYINWQYPSPISTDDSHTALRRLETYPYDWYNYSMSPGLPGFVESMTSDQFRHLAPRKRGLNVIMPVLLLAWVTFAVHITRRLFP